MNFSFSLNCQNFIALFPQCVIISCYIILIKKFQDGSGQYKWLDGWPVLYTNWGNNEPTMRDGEGCVMVKDTAWEDTQCDATRPFMCKIATGM